MKKITVGLLIFLVTFLLTAFVFTSTVKADISPQTAPPDCNPLPNTMGPVNADAAAQLSSTVGQFQCDAEVTYTAKLAARARDTVNWLMKNYRWANLKQKSPGQGTPFDSIWQSMITVAYSILFIMIIVASFLLIITRGRSITVKRFIIRFIFAGVFIWFSFSLVKTIYDLTDIFQAFFVNVPRTEAQKQSNIPDNIWTGDLLNVGWDYKEVKGYRRSGVENDEAAITSLILIKATAATYYTMFVVLIVRKIIMWFFILVSPLLPLLLFFKPVRNTAKIWIGEFFRWVLYAPLFMIFLRGLVEMWKFGDRGESGIPLFFNLSDVAKATADNIMYPTSINLLISGPSKIPLNDSASGVINNINFVDSYVLYLIALIMLWMVIIMPWLLLRIFLDMCCNQGLGQNMLSALQRRGSPFAPFFGGPQVGPSPGVPPSGSSGLAKSLPMTRFKHTPVAEIEQSLQEAEAQVQQEQTSIANQAFSQTATNISNMASNSVSTAQENAASIANVASMAQQNASAVSSLSSSIQGNIAAMQQSSASSSARENLSSLSQSFGQTMVGGNLKIPDLQTGQLTVELLQATNLTIPTMKDIAHFEAAMMSQNKNTPAHQEASKINESLARLSGTSKLVSPVESQKLTAIREQIIKESSSNPVAKSMASSIKPVTGAAIPETNEVQQVNLDDYEEVKKTWSENYRTLDVPLGEDGQPMQRSVWLKQEIQKIPGVIDQLLSQDPEIQKQGMQQVSKILPFLLLGGFSKAEIVSYMKAKLEAAKQVSTEVAQTEKQQDDEDTKISRKSHTQAQKTMSATIEAEKSALTQSSTQSSIHASTQVDSSSGSDDSTDDDVSPLQNISAKAATETGGFFSTARDEAKSIAQEFMRQLSSTPLKVSDTQSQEVTNQLMTITELPIPNIKAIATIDASPNLTSQELKQQIISLENRLRRVEQASHINPQIQLVPGSSEHRLKEIKEKLIKEAQKGNPVAISMIEATKPSNQMKLPEVNNVQMVNLDDYEEVKQTWANNYRRGEPPIDQTGKPMKRLDWLKRELKQIPEVIELLLSDDPIKQEEGKKKVAKILPFLLLGGFSREEIVSYLKAKLQAAKEVLNELLQVEEVPAQDDQKVENVIRHLEEPLPGSDPNNLPEKKN